MLTDDIIAATDEALRQVAEPRFLRTQRGFQGQFYCALQRALEGRDLLKNGRILEMEYQKSARHGMSQRPDIILHVPVEYSGRRVTSNNFAVWALKRHATRSKACEDFDKLDEMFEALCYTLGFFVNIDAKDNCATCYRGKFPDRLRTVAVWRDGAVQTSWGSPGVAPRRGARPAFQTGNPGASR